MRYTALPYQAIVVAAGLLLTACASETDVGGIATPTADGVFKDANVSGLSYRSGDEEDATGSDGGFTYEVGRDVTFHLGDLIIGTAPGQSVVTPIDFVRNGSTSSVEVLNRVRLLMLLDEDPNPANGIQISVALRDRAESTPSIWEPVDFTVTTDEDLNAELTLIMFDLISTLGRQPRSLETEITAIAARNHLEGTLRCVRAGGFRGTLAGGDSGNFGVMVDAATGELRGYAVRDDSPAAMIELDGVQAVSLDQDAFFSSNDPGTGTTFTGSLSNPDQIFGEWEYAAPQQPSGTFLGERVGGAGNAVYRFTATYEGNADAGIYTFDINAANNVSGFAYSVQNNSLTTLVGTLNNNVTLFANTPDPKNIRADVDLATGTISGGDSLGNTLTGSGCRLN